MTPVRFLRKMAEYLEFHKREAMGSSTIKLIQTLDWAKRFSFLRPQNNGNYNEPAITNANIVLQTIVGPPFAWRWNRVVTGFVSKPGQQDYTIFNYLSSTAVPKGWYAVDSNGNSNSQLATTAGTTGSSQPTWELLALTCQPLTVR